MKGWLPLLGLMALIWPPISFAHKPSDSYLTLDLTGAKLEGQWDIALRDLDYALGLDASQDGAITWGELKTRQREVAAYALAHLRIGSNSRDCLLQAQQHLVDNHSDGAYAVLRFVSDCSTDTLLRLEYRLFSDLDPSHRGLIRIRYPSGERSAVLGPDQPSIDLAAAGGPSHWQQFADFWRDGIGHIWMGFDHVLFLLALLLPAVLWREGGQWRQAESLGPVVREVIGIVTAFTVAHSLTLSAAVLGWISLPSRWVESAIAATIVLAALNNLLPMLQNRRWRVAFILGLIHGFGFANALQDLGLPGHTLALALAGFNLGVESGQLVIVAAVLPAAYLMRGSHLYRRVVFQLGSVAVIFIAGLWFLERSLAVNLFSL